jgi:cytidylate kinase
VAELAIAIDGPASSGKGTVARGVAERLGYAYVDTGAMYRSVALLARRRGISWDDEAGLAALATGLRFSFQWADGLLRVIVDGEELTRAIRTDELGTGASMVSRHPAVRSALLGLQRGLADAGGVVMDGRDIGTVVLPDAELKIYLDAALDERARRRHEELVRRGEPVTLHDVEDAMRARDAQDMNRSVAPLAVAADAVVLDSTHLTIRQAIEQVLALAASRRG